MRFARTLFVVLIFLSVAQAAYYYPRLPEPMASHFDGSGAPNGWSSKTSFFTLGGFVIAMLAAVFLLLPAFLRMLPTGWINFPYKDYWLQPSRREESIARMSRELVFFGCASLFLLLAIFQAVYEANLREDRSAPGIVLWLPMTLYGAFTVIWCVRLFVIFRPPAEERR